MPVFNTTLRESYSWNVTLPTLPTTGAGIGWAIDNDLLLGYGNMRSSFGQPTWGGVAADSTTAYGTVWAVSLKDTSQRHTYCGPKTSKYPQATLHYNSAQLIQQTVCSS